LLKKQVSSKTVALVFGIIVICFAVAVYVSAWEEPGSAPPTGNVPTPLNISSEAQAKAGGLLLNTGGYPSGLIVDDGGDSTKGFVGIGTGMVAPSEKLDVVGNIIASGTICDSTGCIGSGAGGGLQCTTRTVSGTAAATAVCMESETITGGGCRPQSGAWVQSAYFSGNSYVCSGLAAGGPNVAVTAYARCCQK